MTERAEPPVTFGGTGGLVWRLRPDDGALATTRRSRPDPSAPDALRPPPRWVPTRLASCGRRWDTALSPERVELAAAPRLARRGRALASRIGTPVSRARHRPRPPTSPPTPTRTRTRTRTRRASGLPPRLRDVRGARGAPPRPPPPWAVPRRVLRRGVAESHAASLRRLRARLPTRSPSRPGPAADSTRAATSSSRTPAATPSSSASLGSPSPTRTRDRVDPSTRGSRDRPVAGHVPKAPRNPYSRCTRHPPGRLGMVRGEDHAPPALCATRDRHGAALCAVGGGARSEPAHGETAPGRRDAALAGASTTTARANYRGGRSRPSTRATPPRTSRSIHTACPRCWWRPRTARCVAWTPPAPRARATGSAPRRGRGRVVGVRVARRTRTWPQLTTPREVRLVDFRARGRGAGDVIATRAATRGRGARWPEVSRTYPWPAARDRLVGKVRPTLRLRDTSCVATTTTTTWRERRPRARVRSTRSRWRATERSNSAIFDDPRRRR